MNDCFSWICKNKKALLYEISVCIKIVYKSHLCHILIWLEIDLQFAIHPIECLRIVSCDAKRLKLHFLSASNLNEISLYQ